MINKKQELIGQNKTRLQTDKIWKLKRKKTKKMNLSQLIWVKKERIQKRDKNRKIIHYRGGKK